jgi:omega-amidase
LSEGRCLAIGQVHMHWTIERNLAAIEAALRTAAAEGAAICVLSELALTGFHRQVPALAQPDRVQPALAQVGAWCAELGIAASVGAPGFGADGAIHIEQVFFDEHGRVAGVVAKEGLTDPEATFFKPRVARPVITLQGLRCSAVICREIGDLPRLREQLPPGSVDVIFVPGALRQDPALPPSDPPPYVRDLQALARACGAWVVQTNWPNALNRPEESRDAGRSAVVSPAGELVFRLPAQRGGVGVFSLGEREFCWRDVPAAS